MRDYYDPEHNCEVTVVESIQVTQPKEFARGIVESYEPRFELEGGSFPDDYAIPTWLSESVYDETLIDPAEHGIRVVDTDSLERL